LNLKKPTSVSKFTYCEIVSSIPNVTAHSRKYTASSLPAFFIAAFK
jgi:hypothetical protein